MIARRRVLLGAGAAAVALPLARPADRGGPYPAYFAGLNGALRAQGIDRPVLLVDLDRLDRNIERVVRSVSTVPGRTYRIVVKSVPSPDLVDYIARRAGTRALMCFHRPFVQAMAALRPDADILLGKPLPVAAVQDFYAGRQGRFDAAAQLQWLIDTLPRLAQYRELARGQGLKLRINLEIDVGLHRGGFESPEALAGALQAIAEDPGHLAFGGLMGYDAHLMGLPQWLARQELPRVKARYREFADLLRARFPSLMPQRPTFNGAGSPTLRHYDGDPVLNDLSAGTCLLKPSHYDLPTLEDFESSAYVATPVLKRLPGARLPTIEWAAALWRAWDPNEGQMLFVYGGNWLADPVAPPGLSPSSAYVSSNQQGLAVSAASGAAVDDFVFFRPRQSEAVLLQFGDLVAMRGGRIETRWPVLATAL